MTAMRMTESSSLKAAIDKLSRAPMDEDVWRYLYRHLRPFVLAIAYRRLKNKMAAEDAAQEVLLRVLRASPFGRIREEAALRAYVWKITVNVVNSHLRKVIRAEAGARRFFEWEVATQTTLAQQFSEQQDRFLMEEALQLIMEQLEPGDRQFLEMVMHGTSLGDAALALDISYSNAGVKYHRLKRRLRKLLTENDFF